MYSHHEMLLYGNEKEQIITCTTVAESHRHNIEGKKPGTKEDALSDSIYVMFQNRGTNLC